MQVLTVVSNEWAYPYPDLLDGTLSGKGDLEDDQAPKRTFFRFPTGLEPWFAFKKQIEEKYGFAFGGSYGVLWQNYSSSLVGEHNAVGGKLTLNLGYELLCRNRPEALWVEMVLEDRRPLGTDLPPLQAGLRSGSLLPTAATWGQFDFGITQFYIRQSLWDNRFQYAIGKIFAPNFINAYPFFDDNRQFFNQSFSTSATIPSPLRGFGLVAALYPIKDSRFYVQPGMYTVNSDDTGWTIDDFFTKNEHFYHVDLGWTSLAREGVPIQSRGPMDRNNYSVSVWYKNKQEGGFPEAHGVAGNVNFMTSSNSLVFVRGGWSDGFLVDGNVSAGFGWRPAPATSDLLGFGVGWARPSNHALRDQYTLELFYRFNVTANFAITPDVQAIVDPALNPGKDVLWALGLRARLTF
jgi:porin